MKGWKLQLPMRKCPACGAVLKGVFKGTFRLQLVPGYKGRKIDNNKADADAENVDEDAEEKEEEDEEENEEYVKKDVKEKEEDEGVTESP